MFTRSSWLSLPVALLCTSIGCAPQLREASSAVAQGATSAVATSTLTVLENDKMRERIAVVLSSPEMQRALAAASRGVVRGAAEQATTDLPQLVEPLTRAVVDAVNANLGGLGASADRLTRHIVGAAMSEALSSRHEAAAQRSMSKMTQTIFRTTATEISESIGPAMHKAISGDVGPAIGQVMKTEVAPALVGLFQSPEVKEVLAATTREIARQAVLGSDQGLAELAEKRKHSSASSPLGAVAGFFTERSWLLAAAVTSFLLGIPIFWLVRERREAKRYRDDAERRSHRAGAILAAMQAIKTPGEDSKDVLSLLRAELFENSGAPERANGHAGHH